MIEDYNEAVREARINLRPCAYLHNYVVTSGYDRLLDPAYLEYLKKHTVLSKGDVVKLREFICRISKMATMVRFCTTSNPASSGRASRFKTH